MLANSKQYLIRWTEVPTEGICASENTPVMCRFSQVLTEKHVVVVEQIVGRVWVTTTQNALCLLLGTFN